VPRFQVFQFLSGFQSCSEISGGSSHTAFNSIPDSRVSRRRGRFRHYTSWFCFQFLSGFQMGAGVADVLAEHFAFNSFPDSSSTSHHRPASGNTLSIPFRIPDVSGRPHVPGVELIFQFLSGFQNGEKVLIVKKSK